MTTSILTAFRALAAISVAQGIVGLAATLTPPALPILHRLHQNKAIEEAGFLGLVSALVLGAVFASLWTPVSEDGCNAFHSATRGARVTCPNPTLYAPSTVSGLCTLTLVGMMQHPNWPATELGTIDLQHPEGTAADCRNWLHSDMFGSMGAITISGSSALPPVDATPEIASLVLSLLLFPLVLRLMSEPEKSHATG